MGIICAPFLADIFLYSHKADSIHGLLKENKTRRDTSPILYFHVLL